MIKIFIEERVIDSVSAIIAPARAIEEPGYIQTKTAKNHASSKHEFHTMAQMAYFQYQDDELDIETVSTEVRLQAEDGEDVLQAGMLLYRDEGGGFHVLMHVGQNGKKLLETVYRYCTRWVRLDI